MTDETPRVDAHEIIVPLAPTAGEGHRLWVSADFARDLERQLSAAQAKVRELEDKVQQLRYISNVNGDWSMKHANMIARAESAESRIAELTNALADEKKLSTAISRDCNETALERNKLHNRIAELEADAERLVAALEEMTPGMPPPDAPCHKGIVSQARCAHCSRIKRARAAIDAARHKEGA